MSEDLQLNRRHGWPLWRAFESGLMQLIGLSWLALLLLAPAPVQADNLASAVSVNRGPLLVNRFSGTLDSAITVRNISGDTLAGPIQLVVESVTPANAALYNSAGRTADDRDYVLLPLANGALAPGASATAILKLLNPGRKVTDLQLSVQGTRLAAATSTSLTVNAFLAGGPDGSSKGPAVGAGYEVRIDGVRRGVTDASGSLTVQVPVTATRVRVTQVPNAAGSAAIGTLVAGQPRSLEVLVGDGGEVYGDATLRIDQVQQFLLQRNASSVTLRFLRDEKPLKLSSVSFVQLSNVLGNVTDLSALFTLQGDGSVAASGAALLQALSSFSGKATLRLDGEDGDGTPYTGSASFYLADFRTRVQLVAPPSRPTLSLAGVTVVARILNTDVLIRAESDANGVVTLPNLPSGNLSLDASLIVESVGYVGRGTASLNKDSLVRLTMRAPVDILNNVPAISVEALPGGRAASVPDAIQKAARQSGARQADVQARQWLLRSQQATLADPTSVSVNVSAAGQDQQIEQSAQLKVPKGTKKLTLTYNVASVEYPEYVLQQSIYNDVWSLSVIDASGGSIYDITRQVNSQLTQEPVWLGNGTTGEVKKEFDVSALAANADVNVILRATTVNIGDDQLPTSVSAKLDAAQQLTIGNITPDTVNANNDGSYYSVPRAGATNTNQRTFTVEVTKPQGSTLTAVSVDLRDSGGGTLMQVLQETAPGQAGVQVLAQDDTSARLKVRVTVQNPASTVAGTPPPTRDLGYRIKVKGTDSSGSEISDQKDVSGKRSLWRMPNAINRYGSRDNGGDDWAARGTYNWMANNLALLRQVNDISGEHGIDLGHVTHAKGTDIDMFHFYLFPNVTTAPGGGLANFNALRGDVIAAFGTLGTPTPPQAAVDARNRVVAWITASRTGLTNLANSASVASVIYCLGPASGGLPGGWCRTLLTAGTATLTTPQPSGPALVQTLNFGTGAYVNAKMANNNVHNDHIHITLAPGQIGE